jgi:hypothetical protein
LTPQKPLRRAYAQAPKAVQQWLAHTYPLIRHRDICESGEIHWGDERACVLITRPGAALGVAATRR